MTHYCFKNNDTHFSGIQFTRKLRSQKKIINKNKQKKYSRLFFLRLHDRLTPNVIMTTFTRASARSEHLHQIQIKALTRGPLTPGGPGRPGRPGGPWEEKKRKEKKEEEKEKRSKHMKTSLLKELFIRRTMQPVSETSCSHRQLCNSRSLTIKWTRKQTFNHRPLTTFSSGEPSNNPTILRLRLQIRTKT